MRAARWLLVAGVAIASLVAVVPINGSNINQTGESASCGPALGAATGWTGPADPGRLIHSSPSPDSDVAVSARAWCQGEAGTWLRPGVAIVGGVLVVAAAIAVGSLLVRPSRPRRVEEQPLRA